MHTGSKTTSMALPTTLPFNGSVPLYAKRSPSSQVIATAEREIPADSKYEATTPLKRSTPVFERLYSGTRIHRALWST